MADGHDGHRTRADRCLGGIHHVPGHLSNNHHVEYCLLVSMRASAR